MKAGPYAVIIGIDDSRGVHAARTLKRHGISVVGIARNRNSYGCKAKAYEKIYEANTSSEKLIEKLIDIAPLFLQKPVLYPCLDTSVLLIAQHAEMLSQWYQTSTPPLATVQRLMDKSAFYAYAQEAGFPIPATFILHSRDEAVTAADAIIYPAVIKPSTSKSPRWLQKTNLKAFRIQNAAEFLNIYDTYSGAADSLIAQEWIEGTDADLYACHCYLDAESNPLVSFTSRKLRQWPPLTGEGCLAVECRDETVRAETIRLLQSVNFRGLGYVEFKKDARTGRYVIIEPNIGRVSGRMGIAEAGGVDLLYTMYCDIAGLPLPDKREQKFTGAKWVHLRRDLQSSLHYWRRGKLTLGGWWQTWRGRKAFALFSLRDPAPFFGDLWNAARLFSSRRERKKRDHGNVMSRAVARSAARIDSGAGN